MDSEPCTVNGVVPDSMEEISTIANNTLARQGKNLYVRSKLVAVTYRNERWLYKKSIPKPELIWSGKYCYPICPVGLTNEIRVEPYDDAYLFKIWDGDKSMIYDMPKNDIVEGPDENNVLGKWTREKKKEVDAHNAEVRLKKAMNAH